MKATLQDEQIKRPQEVREITLFLLVVSIIFAVGGLTLLYQGLFAANGRVGSSALCLGIVFFPMGVINTILAVGFYKMRSWTYPLVKAEVNSTGLSILLGLNRKIKSNKVRLAFGLQAVADDDGQANEKQRS